MPHDDDDLSWDLPPLMATFEPPVGLSPPMSPENVQHMQPCGAAATCYIATSLGAARLAAACLDTACLDAAHLGDASLRAAPHRVEVACL